MNFFLDVVSVFETNVSKSEKASVGLEKLAGKSCSRLNIIRKLLHGELRMTGRSDLPHLPHSHHPPRFKRKLGRVGKQNEITRVTGLRGYGTANINGIYYLTSLTNGSSGKHKYRVTQKAVLVSQYCLVQWQFNSTDGRCGNHFQENKTVIFVHGSKFD